MSVALFFCTALIVLVSGGKQYDYVPIFERLQLIYANQTYLKEGAKFTFFKYNRTSFALNVTFDLKQDLDGRRLESTTKAFYYAANEYRFSGIQLKVNACEMFSKDMYGITTQMRKYGNIVNICDVKKGHYYLYNFMPDTKYFPKSIPMFRYKIEIHVENVDTGMKLLELHWYGRPEIVLPYNRKS